MADAERSDLTPLAAATRCFSTALAVFVNAPDGHPEYLAKARLDLRAHARAFNAERARLVASWPDVDPPLIEKVTVSMAGLTQAQINRKVLQALSDALGEVETQGPDREEAIRLALDSGERNEIVACMDDFAQRLAALGVSAYGQGDDFIIETT